MPTDTEFAGTAFMAAYLSPSQPGFGALGSASLIGYSSLSARMMGSTSELSDRASALPPVSPLGGLGIKRVPRGVQGGPPLLGYRGQVDPDGSSPPCRSGSSLVVTGGLVPPLQTPVQIPSVRLSRSLHTEPGEICGGSKPPTFMAPPASGPAPSCQPDPD